MKRRNVGIFSETPKNAGAAPGRIFGGAAYGGYYVFKAATRGLCFAVIQPNFIADAVSRKYRPEAGERGYG